MGSSLAFLRFRFAFRPEIIRGRSLTSVCLRIWKISVLQGELVDISYYLDSQKFADYEADMSFDDYCLPEECAQSRGQTPRSRSRARLRRRVANTPATAPFRDTNP